MKKIFFSADWHLGHENVIKYSKRPFENVEHMHRVLINNYNACVHKDGVCYFLGDIGVSTTEICKEVISQLNGTKVLILGNHDKKSQAMYFGGFDVVLNTASLVIGGELVTMSHHPLPGIVREDISDIKGVKPGDVYHGSQRPNAKLYTVTDQGQYHLHGHIHSPNGGRSEKTLDRQYDVGVDANKYYPVSSSTIEAWIAKHKREYVL